MFQLAMDITKSVVLLVEDDPLILLHARMTLEDAGHEVLAVADGENAMEQIRSRSDITALFTDIELAGALGGMELAAAVREERPGMAIVITSGKHALGETALPAGGRFMAKPYTAAQMRRALGEQAA